MSDLYIQRCNDPTAREAWRSSGLVRIDTLHAGDVFECISGHFWTVDRVTHSGTILVQSWGEWRGEDTFCPSAMVRPVMRKTYTTP